MAKNHDKRDEVGIPLTTPVTPIPISELNSKNTFRLPRTIRINPENEENVVLDYYQLTAEQFENYQDQEMRYWAEIMAPQAIEWIMAQRKRDKSQLI